MADNRFAFLADPEFWDYVGQNAKGLGKKLTTLNTPDMSAAETAADIGLGFAPGIGTAMAGRDFERARRDDDLLGMGLSALGMVPFLGGAVKPIKNALTASEKAAQTRLGKVMRNKGVQHRETMRGGDTVTEDVHSFGERAIVSPESMQGKVGVQVQGDRTKAGSRVLQVDGVPLDSPVLLEGGPAYSQMNKELGTGAGWASMRGAASGKQNQFNRAAEETGRDVIGVYSAMGLDGADFATPIAETMVKQLQVLRPNKAAIEMADREIRSRSPEFVGLRSENALAQLLGHGKFPMERAGSTRKALVETLKKAEYQNQGFPVYDDIVKAVTQNELRNARIGDSGYSMFAARPGGRVKTGRDVVVPHGSYDSVIPGDYIGGLERMVPPDVMFPKTYAKHRALGRNQQQTHRSMQINNRDYEIFDQEWLDNIMRYLATDR